MPVADVTTDAGGDSTLKVLLQDADWFLKYSGIWRIKMYFAYCCCKVLLVMRREGKGTSLYCYKYTCLGKC